MNCLYLNWWKPQIFFIASLRLTNLCLAHFQLCQIQIITKKKKKNINSFKNIWYELPFLFQKIFLIEKCLKTDIRDVDEISILLDIRFINFPLVYSFPPPFSKILLFLTLYQIFPFASLLFIFLLQILSLSSSLLWHQLSYLSLRHLFFDNLEETRPPKIIRKKKIKCINLSVAIDH